MAKSFGALTLDTLKSGLVDGPTLYGSQKVVAAVDMAAGNYLGKKIPQEVRTPVVGLVLALVPAMAFGDHGYSGKVSEFLLASAVAQTLALAGNGGTGQPGTIDAMVNKALAPIASLGLPPATVPAPTASTNGYLPTGQRGYLPTGQRGFIPMGGGRANLRGFVSEHGNN